MSASSTLSRRISEFVGVLLVRRRAAVAHRPGDLQPGRPGVVLQHRAAQPRHEPGGARRRVPVAELSFQVLGYAAYLFPVLAAVVGWCRFWCTPIDAPYTKIIGVVLLFASTASFLGLALAAARVTGPDASNPADGSGISWRAR